VEEKKFGGQRVRRDLRGAKLRNAEFESVADVHALEEIRITQTR